MAHLDSVLKIFLKNIGMVSGIEKLDSSNNEVYLVKTPNSQQFIIKLYPPDLSQLFRPTSVEAFAHKKLINCSYVKKILATGIEGGRRFSISEYLPGFILADNLHNIEESKKSFVVLNIIGFLNNCSNIHLNGYGDILDSGKGKYSSWKDFISGYIARMELRAQKLNSNAQGSVIRYFSILKIFFLTHSSLFNITNSCLVPADLNLKNIIIDSNHVAKIIDLETFFAGDIHLALGELMAHTYGTWLCRLLFELYSGLSSQDLVKIRFYAFLSNLSVLVFILERGITDINNQVPWGNKLSFIQLLNTHAAFLKKNHLFV